MSVARAEKIKILFCIDAMGRGGTELQLEGLINRIDRNRFIPILCTIKPYQANLAIKGTSHLSLDVPRIFTPAGVLAMWKLTQWMKNEKIDIVQTYFQDSTLFAGIAARLAGVPVRLACFRDLGFWRTPVQEKLLRRVYPQMTGFLANSKVVKDHFVQRDGIDPRKITVIYNGIDSGMFPFVNHDLPTLNIGIVGNLNRRVKRTDLFIKAAGLVAADHPEVNWHILGDGIYREELKALAHRIGLGNRVHFYGRIANIPDYLAGFQVGVLCSDSEGFSNALLEYMVCGCAAVATDVGGNQEALIQGETGLLVPPDDPEALATALKILVIDTSLRQRLASNARLFVEENFDWNSCVTSHEAIYCEGPFPD